MPTNISQVAKLPPQYVVKAYQQDAGIFVPPAPALQLMLTDNLPASGTYLLIDTIANAQIVLFKVILSLKAAAIPYLAMGTTEIIRMIDGANKTVTFDFGPLGIEFGSANPLNLINTVATASDFYIFALYNYSNV